MYARTQTSNNVFTNNDILNVYPDSRNCYSYTTDREKVLFQRMRKYEKSLDVRQFPLLNYKSITIHFSSDRVTFGQNAIF